MKTLIKFIIKIYILFIISFGLFRLLLVFLNLKYLAGEPYSNIFKALVMGVRFDVVITGYISLLPVLMLLILYFTHIGRKFILKNVKWWYIILSFSVLLIGAADIPYFQQFFNRFEIQAFKWINTPWFVIKMIFEEPMYIIYLFIFIIFYTGFIFSFIRIYKNFTESYNTQKTRIKLIPDILISFALLGLIFVGIRGRLEKKSPIRVGTAYFCNNQFLNKLGLNPVFTFMRTYLDNLNDKNKPINLMASDKAIKITRQYLSIKNNKYKSPIARYILPDTIKPWTPNIVIVIMESMSAAKMGIFGNKDSLTPFLDSLSYKSVFFTNIFSAGEHTYNGIFSTLFSYPAIFSWHPMKYIRHYNGISYTLKQYGYHTMFFINHDAQFDNIEGFLRGNDFDEIISQKNYPSEEVKTTLGVPDDFMFRYAVEYLSKRYKQNKPFFAAFMTASDHGPYYIPPYFKHKRNDGIKKDIVRYADWSLKIFMEKARKTTWFDSTIFVFIADHGAAINVKYPVPLNYHHTPLIFYSKLLIPKVHTQLGSQIDVFPTIMGILSKPFLNNTFGIDLLKKEREYTLLNADVKVGVLSKDKYLLVTTRNLKDTFFYRLPNIKPLNINNKANNMLIYMKATLQTHQYMLDNNLTFVK